MNVTVRKLHDNVRWESETGETGFRKRREFVRSRNEEEDIIFEVHMGNECDLKPFCGCQQRHFGVLRPIFWRSSLVPYHLLYSILYSVSSKFFKWKLVVSLWYSDSYSGLADEKKNRIIFLYTSRRVDPSTSSAKSKLTNCLRIWQVIGGTRWHRWLIYGATSRKVAGSIPDVVIVNIHWHITSGCTVTLGLTQPLRGMSFRGMYCRIKTAGVLGWQIYHPRVRTV